MAYTDKAIYLEAVTNDGGTHNPASVWWLSPDIQLNPVGSSGIGTGLGLVGANKVDVTVHRKNGQNVSSLAGEITVDVFVCNPTPSPFSPAPSMNTKKITSGVALSIPGPITTGVKDLAQFNWTITSPAPTSAEGEGHKCMVARCYPDNNTPATTTFEGPTAATPGGPYDQHIAQRNICIIKCDSPCGLDIEVFTINPELKELVTLFAVADLKPTRQVQAALLPMLQQTPGFKQFATAAPPPFALQFPRGPDVTVRDYTRERYGRLYGGRRNPNFSAHLSLQPREVVPARFETDLEGVNRGDAYIYHVTQRGRYGRIEGGLTIVMVRG